MRHTRAFSIKTLKTLSSTLLGAFALGWAGGVAQAQVLDFTTSDWLTHRSDIVRSGGNGDPGIAPKNLRRVYVYPPTADMPAEIVLDNPNTLPIPAPNPDPNTGAGWDLFGAWQVVPFANRTPGAWPYTSSQGSVDKVGDYLYIDPRGPDDADATQAGKAKALSDIGLDVLGQLPNLGTSAGAAATYKTINDLLDETQAGNNTLEFFRWNFGTRYPSGTYQGTNQISPFAPAAPTDLAPLAPNQRYAVYIRFPNSGTLVDGTNPRPNTDHVMVRVSWGATINDPTTSRIFMMNFGETGGFWERIRTGPGDDRYFPYDGVNPIRVTLYTRTPDLESDPNQPNPPKSIIVADAVRLVPEAQRGDIHASAASARFPGTVLPAARTIQRTYFGRDETTGPIYVKDIAQAGNYPPNGFTAIAFDPTRPPQTDSTKPDYNPIIGDPSSSLRMAAFYCLEDDFANNRFGRLAWRYVARRTPVQTTTVDDTAAAPSFQASNLGLPGGWVDHNPAPATEEAFANSYKTVTVTDPPAPPTVPTPQTAVWQASLPYVTNATQTGAGETYSVYVWMPAGDPALHFAHHAQYIIGADGGDVVVTLDQRNVEDTAIARVGTWRRLASGIRFPVAAFNGNPSSPVGKVTLVSDSHLDFMEDPTRVVVADALQFVAESQSSNSVVASPTIANVTWPSGTVRQVVYFATTDGHVWALDALGGANNSTLTTAYWVYPSISNPDPAGDLNGNGAFDGPQEDPNNRPDAFNNEPTKGIDADLVQVTVNGTPTWVATNKVPDLGPFTSSPIFVRRRTANPLAPEEMLLVPNMNGRVYAFDPAGRPDPATGNPFAATAATADNPGVPGTTRRWMTWPSVARDKWLRSGATKDYKIFSDDPAKGFFAASLASPPIDPADPLQAIDHVVAGAGDGHVYSVNLKRLTFNERISNSYPNLATQDGQPRWMYPDAQHQLPAIVYAGALMRDTFNGVAAHYRYTFSAGGRVYAVKDRTDIQFNEQPGTLEWVYPFTTAPPGNPGANDLLPEVTDFTSPAVRTGLGINAGKYVAFVANRDGRIFALDANAPTGTAPTVLWVSSAQGPTRASATFLSSLQPQTGFTSVAGPAIFLPNDTGGIVAYDAILGRVIWAYYDALIGSVPLPAYDQTPPNPTTLPFPTSYAWRGADAIMSNSFVYEGDEGNQDTGEMHGQFRAYGSEDIGLVTAGEPEVTGGLNTTVEMRLVDLWNAHRDDPNNTTDPTLVWENFNNPPPTGLTELSPYFERLAGHQKPNTQGNFVVYEWGDTIYAAAFGYYTGFQPPQVTFTLSSGTTTRSTTVGSRYDQAYFDKGGPTHYINDGMGTDQEAKPFVAIMAFPLGRGNDQDPQTPGRNYTLSAFAQSIGIGVTSPSNRLFAGQFDPPAAGEPPAVPPKDPNDLQPPRTVVIAHPFAVSTRGIPGGVGVGPGVLNSIGMTTNYPVNGTTGDLSEIVTNGNVLVRIDANTGALVPAAVRDLVAPLGLIAHGTTGNYQGIDGTGKSVPALYVADRSNLYKIGQTLNNLRIARTDLAWGWDPANIGQQTTGNVMNPLPWEVFPNTVPNISFDYPDVDRTRATVKADGIDLASRSISLQPPTVASGVKTLNPRSLDLVVSVPRYQPANVNRTYYALDGTLNPGMPQGLLAPISTATGTGPFGTAYQTLMAPSAGYYGTVLLYIQSGQGGNNQNVNYQGTQALRFFQGRPAIPGAREDVFRQFTVAAGVPPDLNMRSEEVTVDIGNVPHGMGYSPTAPFAPAYSFLAGGLPYNSPWDQENTPRQFFLPFTLKNQGNVNLWNVRIARIIGDYQTSVNDPNFWVRMLSDQVDPITGPPIWSRSFNLLGTPAVGNIGVISTLDHPYGDPTFVNPTQPETVNDLNGNLFWPYVVPNGIQDYVLSPNVLNWAVNTRGRPTLHKPLVETTPQTMSVPDVAPGDRFNLLNVLKANDVKLANNNPNYPQFPRDTRPRISVAVPLTTPAGTYTTTILPYEDFTPAQWRDWLSFYRGSAVGTAGDNDGKLNVALATTPNNTNLLTEPRSDPGFTLKVTVRESRITNGVTPGSFPQIDVRGQTEPAFGANVGPVALRDPASHQVVLYFASNRLPNYQSVYTLPNPSDAPWFLNFSTLNSVDGNVAPFGPIYDWRYEMGLTRWWDPLPANSQYPAPSITNQIFPSQASDVAAGNPPLVPGTFIPETVRHASPATTISEPLSGGGAQPVWLFWQGVVYKGASTGAGAGNRLDTRTFYVQLQNGLPPANALPNSFLNDPALPKFGPKPLVMTDLAGGRHYFLFWYGGAQGRTRLYYNVSTPAGGGTPPPDSWSPDTALNTPATLQWQSDPTPIHRIVYDPVTNQNIDAIDLIYTGVLGSRKLAETMMTRYRIIIDNGKISLRPMQLTLVDSETLAREGNTNTWNARDLAWLARDPVTRNTTYTDANGRTMPFFQIYLYDRANAPRFAFPDNTPVPINGYTRDATGNWVWNEPSFDQSTQRWVFRSALGGELIIDTQAGTVSFSGVSPRQTDRVSLYYVPQTLRINVTRNESGAVAPPAGWGNDPAFQPRPHVAAAGSNTGPVAFLDRAPNSRGENVLPAGAPMPVTRLWTFYRKTNTNVTATATLYYKTMRLMVRLPRGVLRDVQNGQYTFAPNITIANNRGPVEVDWVRGRLYFTEVDEGNLVSVKFNYGRDNSGNKLAVPETFYRVGWGDEISTAVTPGDQPTNEVVLPTDSAVNEGQVTAFKDPFQEKVWVFWASTRFGTTDLYYMTLDPPFYALPAQ